ncbi:MARS2_1 [Sanghuangporus sanghuang]
MEAVGWRDKDWIGRGLKYLQVNHLPVVKRQEKLTLHIPEAFDKARPLPNLSVKALLCRLESVTQGYAAVEHAGGDFFSTELPNVGLEQLFKATVLPSKEILDDMWKKFGQAWLDGKNSITDFSDPDTHYPLAALAVYREFAWADALRKAWNSAEEWMMRGKRTPGLSAAVSLVQRLMFAFGWDTDLRALYTTVPFIELLALLRDGREGWLADCHIDMLMQILTDRLEREYEDSGVLIAPCCFQQYLLDAYKRSNDKNRRDVPLMNQYKEDFLSGRKRQFFMIANVNGNHWVPWTFVYSNQPQLGHARQGDSLRTNESDMTKLRTALVWWIDSFIEENAKCSYAGNILVHGDQMGDSDSCGIVAYNTIAHALFGDELWTLKERKRHRVEAFNAIIMRHNARQNNLCVSATETYALKGQELQIPPDSHPKDVLQVPFDSCQVTNPPSCAFQDPFASRQVANSPSCVLQDKKMSGSGHEDMRGKDSPMGNLDSKSMLSTTTGDNDASLQEMHMQNIAKYNHAKNLDGSANAMPSTGCKRPRETADLESDEFNGAKGVKKRNSYKKGPLDAFFGFTRRSGLDETGSPEDTVEEEDKVSDVKGNLRGHELVVGVSKSALNSKKLREACLSGTFTPNEKRLHTFKVNIHAIDPHAQFDPGEWTVRHSRCRNWLKMKSAYSALYFREHVNRCKIKSTLHDFTSDKGSLGPSSALQRLSNKPPSDLETVPCAGLTSAHDTRIKTYLARPSALGGGGRSKISIAKEWFGKTYGDLNKRRKRQIDKIYEDSWAWVVKHQYDAVFSTSCKKFLTIRGTSTSEDEYSDRTCGHCLSLLHNKVFRDIISTPEPQPSNLKFVNRAYLHEALGVKFVKCKGVNELLNPKDKNVRLIVRYAQGVAEGKFKEHNVFTGLVDAVLQRLDREARGKKMTNFQYTPAFDEFIQTVFLVCPRAHKLLAAHFPVRSERSLRRLRAKEPQFLPGISSRSFELADKFVSALRLPRRVIALSADDTKLLPTFRPFFNSEEGKWYIVGGTGESLLVNDPDKLRDELDRAQLKKATKVRIWAMIVPLPKIPPVVLAAMAITDEVTAATLTEYTVQIIDGLHEKDLWPVSYACDGAEKERANQRNLRAKAHEISTKIIRSPSPTVEDIEINIPRFHDRPLALVQDSQHARKTYRNNLETGTKTLVLGNDTATYGQLREMAFDDKSPLYHRDVENPDKQDDRAAARVFTSFSLNWFIAYRPDYLGIQTYLFVFGDLCDGWQNRSNSHGDRLLSILRAHYFLEIWLKFLQDAGYPVQKHCISRESIDITSYLVKSYIELLIIFRDDLGGEIPFVPWLHSSEVCEHMFGELRKEVKDFDFASFLHTIPKTHWMVRYSMGLGNVTIDDAKARASGYAHTWLDLEGLSLSNLRAFPTDEEMDEIANEACKDAVNLWEQLGLHPNDIRSAKQSARNMNDVRVNAQDNASSRSEDDSEDDARIDSLPSISEWYLNPESLCHFTERSHDESEVPGLNETSRFVLERLLEREEETYRSGPVRLAAVEDTMLNISCAKLLLDFDTALRIDDLVTPSMEQWDRFHAEYASEVGKCLVDGLPPILGQFNRPAADAAQHLPPSRMLELRRANETQFAKKAVRTTTTAATAAMKAARESEAQDSQARQSLIKKISDVLKLQQDQGVGTGLERKARWTTPAQAGNSANAAIAKAAKASKIDSRRREVYSRFKFPRIVSTILETGAINETNPLFEDSFAVVFTNKQVLVGKVISMYTKGAGQNGKHCYLPNASSIGQLSYISLQTFEYTSNHFFRVIHSSRAHLRVRSFAHVPPHEFLFALPDIPNVKHNGNAIELSEASFQLWHCGQKYSNVFPLVTQALRKRY